jgi:hypothetical protein
VSDITLYRIVDGSISALYLVTPEDFEKATPLLIRSYKAS